MRTSVGGDSPEPPPQAAATATANPTNVLDISPPPSPTTWLLPPVVTSQGIDPVAGGLARDLQKTGCGYAGCCAASSAMIARARFRTASRRLAAAMAARARGESFWYRHMVSLSCSYANW